MRSFRALTFPFDNLTFSQRLCGFTATDDCRGIGLVKVINSKEGPFWEEAKHETVRRRPAIKSCV